MDNSDDFWDLPAAPEDTYETTVLPTADEPAPEVEKKRNARTVILGSVLLALVVIVGLAAAIGLKNWHSTPATEETTASTPQATIAPTIPTQDATIAPQAAPTPQAAATTPTAPSTQPAPAVIDPDTLTFASVKQARAVVISKDITAVDGQLVFTLRIALPEGKQGGTYAYTVTKSQYDSYESGSLIDLQYRVDQDGRIAIVR
ncbi:MAG: hypothetical protein HXL39_00270 [Schaalia sp.]|jgi:hypothetical protein|uniref:Uncharacterized protein n=1 Tax=Rothia mucilaginosa TaxID=43675 RepID=A0A930Q408_9MICC|nr:hypothetical protein [Schaalia sp.]MBF1673475.1 hypothetical protein [Rothia mucilaginosa]